MYTDLMMSLMNLNSGVASPAGLPMLQSENPMAGLQGLPASTVPAATPPLQQSANPALPPGKPAKSLEEQLFGFGGNIFG